MCTPVLPTSPGLRVTAPDPRVDHGLEPVPRCPVCASPTSTPVLTHRAQMWRDPSSFTWVQCAPCGLVYLDPRVPAAEIGRFYQDYLPHRGPAAWGRWAEPVAGAERQTDRRRLEVLRGLGAIGPSQTVLDVGCGRPSFLRLVHDRTGARAVGTDFDDSGWASDSVIREGLELHAGELEALEIATPVDRITMWQVLEHLYQPVETLSHLRALARPGTLLVVEVPDYAGLTRRWQGRWWAGYHTPRHAAAYTPVTLRGALERAGWRVVRQYQWGTLDPYLLWWLGDQERRGAGFTGSLESRFVPFLLGKLVALPLTLLHRWVPLGFQTAIAVA